MKNRAQAGYAMVLLFLLTGCEKVIEPKSLPEQDPRLVLNCVVRNDSLIRVNISSSKSILSGKDYRFIENANCELYVDDQYAGQLQHSKEGNYSGSIVGVTNHKYTLKVTAPGFNGVTASTVVRENVLLSYYEPYDTVNYHFRGYYPGSGGGEIKLRLRWNDNQGENNYYEVHAELNLFDSLGNSLYSHIPASIRNNKTNTNSYFRSYIDVNDAELVNGREVWVDATVSAQFNGQTVRRADIVLTLANVSEDLYKYNSTLAEQYSTGAGLFAEPVQVHNNIEGGMGIMGSTNSNTVLVYSGLVKVF